MSGHYLSIRQMWGRFFPGGLLLMLWGYFDDSGTHDGSAVVVWGGLLGTEDQWQRLENRWLAKLREPLPGKSPIKRFHLYDCATGTGEFMDYSPAERDRARFEFRDLIISERLLSIASAVSRPDWDQLIVGGFRDKLGSAEQPAFVNCIGRSLEIARSVYPTHNDISLAFDKAAISRFRPLADQIVAFEDRPHPKIGGINFWPVQRFAGLQAADTVATESYWAAERYLGEGSTKTKAAAHFAHFLSNMNAEGLIADREVILETRRRLEQEGVRQ